MCACVLVAAVSLSNYYSQHNFAMKLFNCKGLNKQLVACTCTCILYVCDFLVELHCACNGLYYRVSHERVGERERERRA